jgi:hypothetical protein
MSGDPAQTLQVLPQVKQWFLRNFKYHSSGSHTMKAKKERTVVVVSNGILEGIQTDSRITALAGEGASQLDTMACLPYKKPVHSTPG